MYDGTSKNSLSDTLPSPFRSQSWKTFVRWGGVVEGLYVYVQQVQDVFLMAVSIDLFNVDQST